MTAFGFARSLDRQGQGLDERTVVQCAGQRVPSGGVDEGLGLAADPSLGGPEHEEQREGGDETGRQRDQDDVAAHRLELGEDGRGVAPDADDRLDLPVGDQREVLAQDGGRRRGPVRRPR